MSYEAELLALAVVLYLYDSVVLLHSNEAIFSCGRGNRWRVVQGRGGLMLAGRSVCLLNPLAANHPCFRLRWDFDELPPADGDFSWTALAQPAKRLAPTTLSAAIALFGLLPLGMFTGLGAYGVISAAALLYGSAILGLVRLRRMQKATTLRLANFAGFAFECLACPPFAANMLRRLTLAQRVSEPVPLAACRLLDSLAWEEQRARCMARLDEALQWVADDSLERRSLEAQKLRLSALECRS